MQDHPSKRCSFYLALRRRKKATTKCWSLSLLHEKKYWIREIWIGDFLLPYSTHLRCWREGGVRWGIINSSSFFPLVRALLFLIVIYGSQIRKTGEICVHGVILEKKVFNLPQKNSNGSIFFDCVPSANTLVKFNQYRSLSCCLSPAGLVSLNPLCCLPPPPPPSQGWNSLSQCSEVHQQFVFVFPPSPLIAEGR